MIAPTLGNLSFMHSQSPRLVQKTSFLTVYWAAGRLGFRPSRPLQEDDKCQLRQFLMACLWSSPDLGIGVCLLCLSLCDFPPIVTLTLWRLSSVHSQSSRLEQRISSLDRVPKSF